MSKLRSSLRKEPRYKTLASFKQHLEAFLEAQNDVVSAHIRVYNIVGRYTHVTLCHSLLTWLLQELRDIKLGLSIDSANNELTNAQRRSRNLSRTSVERWRGCKTTGVVVAHFKERLYLF